MVEISRDGVSYALAEAGYPCVETTVPHFHGERAAEWQPVPPRDVWEKAREVARVGDYFAYDEFRIRRATFAIAISLDVDDPPERTAIT